jgi:hypothetical protein
VKRLSGWLLPLLLAVAGGALIIASQLDLDAPPSPSLPDIPDVTPTEVAIASPTPSQSDEPTEVASPTMVPTPTPLPAGVVATQLQVESVGINVRVLQATDEQTCGFPPSEAAYILCGGLQPGQNGNSYIFAHAVLELFKPLWNVQIGAEVKVLMSDGTVLRYRVTEVHPNVACPDDDPDNPELNPEALGITLPLALQYADDDCAQGVAWTLPTDHERLTLQTSQGYNRNWGELVIVAVPIGR